MTNNVQHFLMECHGIETRIRAKQNEIAKYREIATGISPNYDGLPRGGSQGSKIENAVLRIAELCEEIEAETAALVSCRRRAKCIIDSVPDPNQRDVLTYRYLNGYGWDTVALLMDRSRTQVWRIHSAALESAQRIYDVFDMEPFLKKIFSEDAEKRKTEWNETLDL